MAEQAPLMNFWRENRVDQHWTLSEQEVAEGFLAFRAEHAMPWPLERQVRHYMTSRDGLNSVFEEDEFERFASTWWPWISRKLHEGDAPRKVARPPRRTDD